MSAAIKAMILVNWVDIGVNYVEIYNEKGKTPSRKVHYKGYDMKLTREFQYSTAEIRSIWTLKFYSLEREDIFFIDIG